MHKLFGAGAGFRRWQPKRIRSEDEKKYLLLLEVQRKYAVFSHSLLRQYVVFLNSEAVYHPTLYNMAPTWFFSCMRLSGASSPDTAAAKQQSRRLGD